MINEDKVKEFLKQYKRECNISSRFIDLTSEVGEVGKELLKSSEYGNKNIEISEELKEELGDTLFSLLALFVENGIDPEQELDKVLEKYRKRFEENGDISSHN